MTRAAVLMLLSILPAQAYAQRDARVRAENQDEFLAKARVAAHAYVDRESALLDGFRPVGPELPSMGQHWLNPEFANMGFVDPSRPAFLLYVTIDGKPVLGGLGYTLTLAAGETIPVQPFGKEVWHEHAGTIAEEAYAVTHHSPVSEARFRVVALHVWHALPAPDGLFAAENWHLPYLRNGLAPPSSIDQRAARVLALTHGGDSYYSELLRRHADLDSAELSSVQTVLARYSRRAAAWTEHVRAGDAVLSADPASAYESMWHELEAVLPERKKALLRQVKTAWGHAHH